MYKYFKVLMRVDPDELDMEPFGGEDATEDDVDEACMEAIAEETCGIIGPAVEVFDTVPVMPLIYQVIVGNIGTIYDGPSKDEALINYKQYVICSCSPSARCKGESVTLFEDGEPIREHEGYQHWYENMSADEVQDMFSRNRAEFPALCPNCHEECKCTGKDVTVVEYDAGADHRVHVKTCCENCGLAFKDVLRTVGVTLED